MRKLLLITLALAAGLSASAQEPQRGDGGQGNTRDVAAAQGLALLRALAADKSQAIGLSPEDAARTTLGTPLSVMSVELDALRRFKSGDDAAALLKPSAAAFYPVLVDGSVRSGVRVENGDQGWQAARVGNSGLAMAVDRARRALPSPDDPSVTLVQVLALNLVFVGQRDASGWQLAPLVDDASVDLRVGKAETAAAVFARLAPIAQRHNGEPT
jgi:hypothetical protein